MKIKTYLDQSPLFFFYQAHLFFVGYLEPFFKKRELSLLQGLILTACFFEERVVRPSQLSQVFQVSKSNLSHALRDLEKRGYVSRSLSVEDARGYDFQLTSLGKKKTVGLIHCFHEFQLDFESFEADPQGFLNLKIQLKKWEKILLGVLKKAS